MQLTKWIQGIMGLGMLLTCTGCAALWQSKVIRQASFDHNCPEPSVAIVRDNGDAMARAVELDVCGNRRMYRDVGGDQIYLFRDVTEQQTWGGHASPR